VAAPFTSRIPSVRAVVDLIRQGRCTLLSALMQQQIMMLESCIAAYTLSALSLHNARSSVSGAIFLFIVVLFCIIYVPKIANSNVVFCVCGASSNTGTNK